MTRTFSLVAALVVISSLSADEPKAAKPLLDAKPVVVPFETLPSGHMAVMVKVNGKGPYKLIFDTGAPITLLNNKIAKEADLLKDAKAPLIPLFGMKGDVKVKEMVVGTQKLENAAAIIMDHPTVEAISQAFGPIDGIVGFPFFARFKMALDYKAKTMTFTPNGYDPPDVMKSMAAALSATGGDGPQIVASSATWGLTVDKKEKDNAEGIPVVKVLKDGPAAKAGLKVGDRLMTLNGRWTDNLNDTYNAIATVKPGKDTEAVVKRDGKDVKVTIKPIPGQ